MADSTTKDFAIYRFTSGSDTEATINDSEAIGLDYGVNESSDGGVVSFSVGVPQRQTDVPNVGGVRQTTQPATSLISVPITVGVLINEKVQDQAQFQARLLKFAIDNQDVRGVYSKGRFGLRNDKMTGFPTINPTNTAGIRFGALDLDDMINWTPHQIVDIPLLFVGDYTAYLALLEAIG